MPQPKPPEQKARTWREVRAEAVKAERLNEEAVEAHKRRLLAEEHIYAERQEGDEDDNA